MLRNTRLAVEREVRDRVLELVTDDEPRPGEVVEGRSLGVVQVAVGLPSKKASQEYQSPPLMLRSMKAFTDREVAELSSKTWVMTRTGWGGTGGFA